MTTKVNNRMIDGAVINVVDFGAKGDGVTDDTAAIQLAINTGGDIYFPDGDYLVSNTIILSQTAYKITGGNKTRIFFEQSNFPVNGSIFRSLEADRPSGGTIAMNMSCLEFYGYNPNEAAPTTVVQDASAYFATGCSPSNGEASIEKCRFRGFDVAIRGSAWWANSIKHCFFRTYAGEGVAIDLRGGQYTGDVGWSGAFASNSLTIEDNWFNTINDGIKFGNHNVQEIRVQNNTFERIDNVGFECFNSDNVEVISNYWEIVNIPFRIGFTSSDVVPVQEFHFEQNFLDLCGTSFINQCRYSTFRNNNTKSHQGTDYTFFNGQVAWYIDNIIEHTNGLSFESNISTDNNRIYFKGDKHNTAEGIISRVSDANGESVRFTDGTQICTETRQITADCTNAFGAFFRSTDFYSWSFPQAFASGTTPALNVEVATANPTFATIQSSNTSGTYRIHHYQSDGALSVTVTLTAIGRWK